MGDLDASRVGGWLEVIEGEGELDEIGLEGAGDVDVLELAEDVDPSVEGGEEEAELGEVELEGGRRVEGDAEDVELEDALLGEAELVKRDDGARVSVDHRLPDLGLCREGEDAQERRGERRGGGHSLVRSGGGGGGMDLEGEPHVGMA